MDAWRYGIYLLVFTFDISLVRYRCEHSKINSISPCDHVLFSIYFTFLFYVLLYFFLIIIIVVAFVDIDINIIINIRNEITDEVRSCNYL